MERIVVMIDGHPASVLTGCTVAAALQTAGYVAPRRSVTGEARGPLCGMGICFECRVTIDGRPHQRACRVLCREGMSVETGEHNARPGHA